MPGVITKKELEYNERRALVPASNIPLNKLGLLRVWGRSDFAENKKLGVWWQIKNPAGAVVETYSAWETFWTQPGNAQEFIGGRFSLNQTGIWTVNIALWAYPEDLLDQYYGTLCTVVSTMSEFADFIIASYVKL